MMNGIFRIIRIIIVQLTAQIYGKNKNSCRTCLSTRFRLFRVFQMQGLKNLVFQNFLFEIRISIEIQIQVFHRNAMYFENM